MKRSTKQTLGAGLLLSSVILGVYAYKRTRVQGLAGFTPKQLRHARIVRNMAARQGLDLTPKPQRVDKVLPNGMTREFAEKYTSWLKTRVKNPTHKHISPSSLALPVDEVIA